MPPTLDSETRALLDAEHRRNRVNEMVEDLTTAAAVLTDLADQVAGHLPCCDDVTATPVAVEDLWRRGRALLTQAHLHVIATRRVVPPRPAGNDAAGRTPEHYGEMRPAG